MDPTWGSPYIVGELGMLGIVVAKSTVEKYTGIEQVVTAYRSPWQNAYSERLNGSIRRECLDRVIILNERHLHRVLRDYFEYHNRHRVHQSLEMDAPAGRKIHDTIDSKVVAVPHVGGLHHHYERKAA